ncbi:MAG: lantibiotic dehydratase, partial [Acidobacteriota bacterium]
MCSFSRLTVNQDLKIFLERATVETATITVDQVPASKAQAAFFSQFVVRVGGLPVGAVEGLRARRSVAALEQLFEAEACFQDARAALSSDLHQWIGEHKDSENCREWINVRRAINKKRNLPTEKLKRLPPALAGRGQALISLAADVHEKQRIFANELAKEQIELRERFRDEIRLESFQKGLLLASQDLFRSQRRYLGTHPSALRRREKQIERGLLRYFSRAAMKATPFATFCSVV